MLSNLPDATKVDEDSEEFQTVVKKFYETIQEYHSKIRIIQVIKKRLLVLQNKVRYPCIDTQKNSLGGEAHESTAVQSVQVEESKHTATRHLPTSRTDSLSWHK